jgi:transcriptional regulator with XRE-family HTH domain
VGVPQIDQSNVGPKLGELRRQRKLSLAEVAQETGISASFLSLIENGKSDITFGRLIKLLNFFEINLVDLVPQYERDDTVVVRKGDERRVHSPSEGFEVRLLTPSHRRMMSPALLAYEPGAELAEKSVHKGEEFIHVLEGELILEISGSDPIHLQAGDSAYYSAERPHSRRNPRTDVGALVFLVFTVEQPPPS